MVSQGIHEEISFLPQSYYLRGYMQGSRVRWGRRGRELEFGACIIFNLFASTDARLCIDS